MRDIHEKIKNSHMLASFLAIANIFCYAVDAQSRIITFTPLLDFGNIGQGTMSYL